MPMKYSIVENLLPDYKNTIRKLLNNQSLSEIYQSTLTKDTFETDEIKNINKINSFITKYGTLVSGNFKTHNVLLQSIREFTVINSPDFDYDDYNTIEEQIHVTSDEYNYNVEYVDYNKLWERGSLEGIEVWGLGKTSVDPRQVEVSNGELILRQTYSSLNTDLKQVLSLLPHIKNFVLQFDVNITNTASTIMACSIAFRNSYNSFSDNNNTYQYVFGIISNGTYQFGKGTNSQSNVYTQIQTYYMSNYGHTFSTNTWYRIKVIAQDSNFKFYVNDTFIGEVNDTSYTNQGYLQLRIYSQPYSGTPPEQRFKNLQIINLDQLPKNTYVQSWSHQESDNVGNLAILSDKNYVNLTQSSGVLQVKYVRDYPQSVGVPILFDDFPPQKDFEYSQDLKVTTTVSGTQQALGIYEISPHMYIQSNVQSVNYQKYVFALVRKNDNTLWVRISKYSDELQYQYQLLLGTDQRLSSFGITEDVNQFYNYKIRKVGNNYKFYINDRLILDYTSDTSKQYNKVGIEIYDERHSSSNPQTIQIKNVRFTVLDNYFQEYSFYNLGSQNIQTDNGIVVLRKQITLRKDMIYNFGVLGYIKSNSNVEKIEQLITDTSDKPITPATKTEIYQQETLQLQGYVQKISTTGTYNLVIRIHTSTVIPSSYLNGDVYLSDPVLLEYVNTNMIDTQGGYASQDWSKWTHWNNTVYWSTNEQIDDPVYGKIFKGITGTGNQYGYKYLFDYYTYTFISGTTYTFGIWLRGGIPWTGTVKFYLERTTGGVIPNSDRLTTITIDTNWKYFTWTVTPSETHLNAGGLGIEFQGLPTGYTLYAQLPKLEQNTSQTEFLPLPVYTQKSDYPFPIFNLNNQFDLRQSQDWTIVFEYTPFNSDTQTLLSSPKTFTLFSLGTLNPSNMREYNDSGLDYVKSLQFYMSQLTTSDNLFVPYTINMDDLFVTNTQITLNLNSQFQHYSGENITVTSTTPVTINLNDFLFKKHLVVVTYSNTTKTLTTVVILSNGQILQTNIQFTSTVDDVMWTFKYLSHMNYQDGDLILGGVIDSEQIISSYKLQSFVFKPKIIQNALYRNLTLVKNYYTNPSNLNTNVFRSITLGKDPQKRNSNGFYNVLLL